MLEHRMAGSRLHSMIKHVGGLLLLLALSGLLPANAQLTCQDSQACMFQASGSCPQTVSCPNTCAGCQTILPPTCDLPNNCNDDSCNCFSGWSAYTTDCTDTQYDYLCEKNCAPYSNGKC